MGPRSVTIVGAGIGGLTAALALRRRGVQVTVFERTSELGEIGAGLHVSPNGVKVLTALGLGSALESVAAKPTAMSTSHYATGDPNFEAPLNPEMEARFGAPFLSFHRADLHRVLAAAVEAGGISIELGHRLIGISENPEEVSMAFEDRPQAGADFTIGADGVHSVVRQDLHGELATRYTGHVAYRGLAAASDLRSDLIENRFRIWVGPGRHFVAYPVRRGELVNYVALVEEDGWQDESWTTRADASQLAAGFAGWNPTVRALIESTLSGECYKWALLGRDPMATWSTERTTLLGDAAHPMVPYLAQGAVMAIEDAWVLAACLAGRDHLSTALDDYEAARIGRATAVQAAAWEQGQLNHSVGRGPQGEDFHGGRWADPAWIYGHDVVADFPL